MKIKNPTCNSGWRLKQCPVPKEALLFFNLFIFSHASTGGILTPNQLPTFEVQSVSHWAAGKVLKGSPLHFPHPATHQTHSLLQ